MNMKRTKIESIEKKVEKKEKKKRTVGFEKSRRRLYLFDLIISSYRLFIEVLFSHSIKETSFSARIKETNKHTLTKNK